MLFKVNHRYNFTTYAPSVFGDSFKLSKVIGIVSYETARQHSNIDVLQRQVYPLLPVGTPDRVKEYNYVMFESSAGIEYVLAYPWIIEGSIEEVSAVDLAVDVYDVDSSAMGKIRDVLNSMGYNFTIKTLIR